MVRNHVRKARLFSGTAVAIALTALGWLVLAQPAAAAAGDAPAEAATSSPWPSLDQLVAAANKEKELNFLGSAVVVGGTKGMGILQDALNKKYGTDVRINYVPGPSMDVAAQRVIQEVGANQPSFTDIVWAPYADGAGLYKFATPHPANLFPDLPKDALEYGNTAIRVISTFPGVIYNTTLITPDKAPTTLDQVANPAWAGMASSGPGNTMWPDLPFVVGEERATALVKKYAALKPAFIRCGEDARIASGEFAIFFLSCGDYGVRTLQETGAPIAAKVLQDACIILHWYLFVPTTSQRPALAHLFSAFLATPEGQAAYYRAARVSDIFWDTPSKNVFDAAKQAGAKCVDIDSDFTQQHGAELQHFMGVFKQLLGG